MRKILLLLPLLAFTVLLAAQSSRRVTGVIEDIDQTSAVVKTAGDQLVTIRLTPRTRFISAGQAIKWSDLKTHDRIEATVNEDEVASVVRRLEAPGSAPAPARASAAPARASAPAATPAPAGPRDPDDPGPPRVHRGPPSPSRAHSRPLTPPAQTAASAPPAAAPAGAPASTSEAADDRPTLRAGAQPRSIPTAPLDPKMVLIGQAQDKAGTFIEDLPNYVCQQFTTRYVMQSRTWQPLDVVSASVVYEGGKESYRDVAINGRPTHKGMEDTGGSWSTGEFGTILRNLFAPQTQAKFRYVKDAATSGLPASVYDFDVAQPNSTWNVMSDRQTVQPAYHGSVWIDKESARALRIEMQARNLPDDFAFDQVETAVDYAFVTLGTQKFLLPVHSENLSCQRGSSICSRNVIDFRNYHKYFGESKITFDK